MWSNIITFIIGLFAGYFLYAIPMKVSFKNRTFDNKIIAFDNIITSWIKMRNHIYSESSTNIQILDQIYGESQRFIGQCVLVCEDKKLTEDINNLNEKLYRTKWNNLSIEDSNNEIEEIKKEAWKIIDRMRYDAKESTRLDLNDFLHILKGLVKK